MSSDTTATGRVLPTVTRTVTHITATLQVDDTADLSWLDQTDEEMGEGFEAGALERRAAYDRGEWHMVGVIVRVLDEHGSELARDSLWGIESDSGDDYFREVADECAGECAARLGVDLAGVPFTYFESEG